MAAPTEVTVENELDNLQLNDRAVENGMANGLEDEWTEEWGFPLHELYNLSLRFYKEKEGKAMHLSYQDKLKIVAYTKQVKYGKYRPDVSPDVGFLDVVGNDRSKAWQSLGEQEEESAMADFIKQLDTLCPLLRPYIIAHKTERDEKERMRREEEERRRKEEEERERLRLEEEARQQQEQEKQKHLQQEMQIRAALNQQTEAQFRQYAVQQYPDNQEQQETLIKQLQEQHYQQYMQQVYQQQLLHQQQQYQQLQAMATSKTAPPGGGEQPEIPAGLANSLPPPIDGSVIMPGVNKVANDEGEETDEDEEDDTEANDLPPIAAASMWTRKDIPEFKGSLRKDPDAVIKVGSGETVTVRVPTHEDGTCLFWEFATDSYDLGFGVYFEWTIAPSNAVSVHVSESSDEEDIEDEEGGAGSAEGGKGDIEKGSGKKDNRPPTDEIIPVYRRDCQEEVYCGSHMYPGRGVYLLKFDNSYSLWRSKTLYYRVYYTR